MHAVCQVYGVLILPCWRFLLLVLHHVGTSLSSTHISIVICVCCIACEAIWLLCADQGHSQDFIVESGWVRSPYTCVLVCVCVYMFVCVQHMQTDIFGGEEWGVWIPNPPFGYACGADHHITKSYKFVWLHISTKSKKHLFSLIALYLLQTGCVGHFHMM